MLVSLCWKIILMKSISSHEGMKMLGSTSLGKELHSGIPSCLQNVPKCGDLKAEFLGKQFRHPAKGVPSRGRQL